MSGGNKTCPECAYSFKGPGWGGLDAHWRSNHEDVMSYEEAGPLVMSGAYTASHVDGATAHGSVAQKINDFITQRRPCRFCNSCLVESLELTQEAHAAQNTLALATTSDFDRKKGVCSICSGEKLVIAAT